MSCSHVDSDHDLGEAVSLVKSEPPAHERLVCSSQVQDLFSVSVTGWGWGDVSVESFDI